MSFDIKKVLSSIDVSADWIGIREVEETTTIHYIREGLPQANSRSSSHGVMVEVLKDGQFAYASTPSLDEASIRDAVKIAFLEAVSAAPWALHRFDNNVRPPSAGKYRSPRIIPVDTLTPAQINELLIKVYQALKVSDSIISATALVRIVETRQKLISTSGCDIEQNYLIVTTESSATAKEGSVVQRRSDSGMFARSYQAGFEILDEEQLLLRAKKTGEEAIELVRAEECPTETCSLVLAPDQMMLQIHESVGHPLELDRILGDERNYAGWSFVKPEDFGKLRYGSKLMNITFDPTVSDEIASYAYDDSGLEAKKEYIIKDGILLRGLGGLESQTRSGLKGVANFRASSWNRAPIDRMANLNLEPGNSSFEEIISSVKRGVFMTSNRSWSIDDYRNKFQFGCEYGKLIENGKLTKTVRNPNYRGISTPFWNSLKMTGNRDTFQVFGTPNCGKGEPNQIINTGHASPVCLFENIEVFGGAG